MELPAVPNDSEQARTNWRHMFTTVGPTSGTTCGPQRALEKMSEKKALHLVQKALSVKSQPSVF